MAWAYSYKAMRIMACRVITETVPLPSRWARKPVVDGGEVGLRHIDDEGPLTEDG
jgi:hypothetical protein